MTEIEAVERTIKMWEWLRDNPRGNKEDYFIENEGHPRPLGSGAQCYLCDKWINYCQTGDGISYTSPCPLGSRILHCIKGTNSPWALWEIDADDEITHSRKQAQRIVNACERWLKKAVQRVA